MQSQQPLEEAPAVALEVERLVDAIVPQVIVQPAHDLCTRGECALVVRIDASGWSSKTIVSFGFRASNLGRSRTNPVSVRRHSI